VGELQELALYRPAPNPFTGMTRIAYSLDGAGASVDIGVYDIAGRAVRKLRGRPHEGPTACP
jgi:hypothetical protein